MKKTIIYIITISIICTMVSAKEIKHLDAHTDLIINDDGSHTIRRSGEIMNVPVMGEWKPLNETTNISFSNGQIVFDWVNNTGQIETATITPYLEATSGVRFNFSRARQLVPNFEYYFSEIIDNNLEFNIQMPNIPNIIMTNLDSVVLVIDGNIKAVNRTVCRGDVFGENYECQNITQYYLGSYRELSFLTTFQQMFNLTFRTSEVSINDLGGISDIDIDPSLTWGDGTGTNYSGCSDMLIASNVNTGAFEANNYGTTNPLETGRILGAIITRMFWSCPFADDLGKYITNGSVEIDSAVLKFVFAGHRDDSVDTNITIHKAMIGWCEGGQNNAVADNDQDSNWTMACTGNPFTPWNTAGSGASASSLACNDISSYDDVYDYCGVEEDRKEIINASISVGDVVVFNVTGAVKFFFDNSREASFTLRNVLEATAGSSKKFYSNEEGGGSEPVLEINFTINTPPIFGTFLKDSNANDTYIKNLNTTPNEDSGGLLVQRTPGLAPSANSRAIFQFDLEKRDKNISINASNLYLYAFEESFESTGEGNITIYRINNTWDVDFATWVNRTQTENWEDAGGDFDATQFFGWLSEDNNIATGKYYAFNVTSLVQGWIGGTWPNQGLLLRFTNCTSASSPDKCGVWFRDDTAQANQRPVLILQGGIIQQNLTVNTTGFLNLSRLFYDLEMTDLNWTTKHSPGLNVQINNETGIMNFTSQTVGEYTMIITATDGVFLTSSNNFTINITSAPTVPLLMYSLTLPGKNPINATNTSPGNVTAEIEFNFTSANHKGVEPCVVGGNCQNSLTPIYIFKNIGTVNISMNMSLENSIPSMFTIKRHTIYDYANSVELTTSDWNFVNNLGPQSVQNVFLWADCTNCNVDKSGTKVNITHKAINITG